MIGGVCRWIAAVVLLAGLCLGLGPVSIRAAELTDGLQELVDRALPGDTIQLEPGIYEGPLTISKGIILKAARAGTVTLLNRSQEPALKIEADEVLVAGLHIVDEAVKESPSVLVMSGGVRLEGLLIRTGSDGIVMRNADEGEVSGTTIEWGAADVRMADKGNGIDLYNSHRVRLNGNAIRDVHDGIYLENSDDTTVIGNRIERSRYGVHCMYTRGTSIRDNEGLLNVTGAMVMAVRDVDISTNTFMKQNENVNSQGILLYDAHDTLVADNTVEGNRVGLYVELSTGNRIESNAISYNFIGIQLLESSDNWVSNNRFQGNVADAQARSSEDNDLNGNYWDTFRGIDADGDGRSDIGYAINPFFQSLTGKRPAFQLFFQSPGMMFLEGLYQSERQSWTKDKAPLMAPPYLAEHDGERGPSGSATGLVGLLLLGGAGTMILMTRRRSI